MLSRIELLQMWQDIESVLLGDHFTHQGDVIVPKMAQVFVNDNHIQLNHDQQQNHSQIHNDNSCSSQSSDLTSLTTVQVQHLHSIQHQNNNSVIVSHDHDQNVISSVRFDDMTLDLTEFMLSADATAQLYANNDNHHHYSDQGIVFYNINGKNFLEKNSMIHDFKVIKDFIQIEFLSKISIEFCKLFAFS